MEKNTKNQLLLCHDYDDRQFVFLSPFYFPQFNIYMGKFKTNQQDSLK